MQRPQTEDDPAIPEADRLLAATIYLMSCHARSHCPRLACMIGHHLELIARHPGAGARIAVTCKQLANAWVAIRRHDENSFTHQGVAVH
jgi:hypothetical protein